MSQSSKHEKYRKHVVDTDYSHGTLLQTCAFHLQIETHIPTIISLVIFVKIRALLQGFTIYFDHKEHKRGEIQWR